MLHKPRHVTAARIDTYRHWPVFDSYEQLLVQADLYQWLRRVDPNGKSSAYGIGWDAAPRDWLICPGMDESVADIRSWGDRFLHHRSHLLGARRQTITRTSEVTYGNLGISDRLYWIAHCPDQIVLPACYQAVSSCLEDCAPAGFRAVRIYGCPTTRLIDQLTAHPGSWAGALL